MHRADRLSRTGAAAFTSTGKQGEMQKLKLNPDVLRVESFAAVRHASDGRGTVNAHEPVSRNCPQTGNTCDCTLGCTMAVCTTS
jgi:hypothetical protein